MADKCANCHTDNEDGTWTGLTAEMNIDVNNLDEFSGDTEADLDQYIVDAMPSGTEGECVDECASNIAAYMWSYREDSSNTIVIPVDETSGGWRVNPERTWSYVTNGVNYEPTAHGDQLVYDLASPLNLTNAELTIEYEADANFIASGAAIQPFAQSKNWEAGNAHWGCWIDAASISAGSGTSTCTLSGIADVTTDHGIQIGIQIPSGTEEEPSPIPAGSVTITGMSVELAE